MILKKLYLVLGGLMLLIFLLTGMYMDQNLNHLSDMESVKRILYRAGHIYILFIALIYLSIGCYFKYADIFINQMIQYLSFVILFTSACLAIISFFIELAPGEIERTLSRFSIYFALTGTLLNIVPLLIKNEG
jgi:hypothetical protein